MKATELKAKIQTNAIPNFLIFTGEEWAVQQIFINQIVKRQQTEKKYMDTVYDVIPKLGNKSFIGSQKSVYLVRDDLKFVADDKMWDRVISLLGTSTLILLISKPDKRLKFYTTYKNAIVEFETLNPQDLKKYIRKEINLNDKSCDKLIEVCESNYGRILLEIDKIKHFGSCTFTEVDNNNYDANKAFEMLLKDGTIYTPPKDAIFDFVDAVLDRKVKTAFNLYENCKGVGESTFALLTVLFNNAKAVLQVQTCTSKDVSKSTGLTGWQIMNAKKHLDVYNNEELVYMLELIDRYENGIKMGTIDEKYVIDNILVRVL